MHLVRHEEVRGNTATSGESSSTQVDGHRNFFCAHHHRALPRLLTDQPLRFWSIVLPMALIAIPMVPR